MPNKGSKFTRRRAYCNHHPAGLYATEHPDRGDNDHSNDNDNDNHNHDNHDNHDSAAEVYRAGYRPDRAGSNERSRALFRTK